MSSAGSGPLRFEKEERFVGWQGEVYNPHLATHAQKVKEPMLCLWRFKMQVSFLTNGLRAESEL